MELNKNTIIAIFVIIGSENVLKSTEKIGFKNAIKQDKNIENILLLVQSYENLELKAKNDILDLIHSDASFEGINVVTMFEVEKYCNETFEKDMSKEIIENIKSTYSKSEVITYIEESILLSSKATHDIITIIDSDYKINIDINEESHNLAPENIFSLSDCCSKNDFVEN